MHLASTYSLVTFNFMLAHADEFQEILFIQQALNSIGSNYFISAQHDEIF